MRRFLLGNTVKERMVRESNRFPPFELAREWMALVGRNQAAHETRATDRTDGMDQEMIARS